MKASEIISRLSSEATYLPKVIAPVLSREGTVRVMISNHPYHFRVSVTSPGWYILAPLSSVRAEVSRPAEPFEVQRCLQNKPRLRVIAMRRLEKTSWLIFPYNLSDARSRHFRPEPERCHLVDRNIEPFASFHTRVWGHYLIFEPAYLVPAPPEYLQALQQGQVAPPALGGLNPEYRIVYQMLIDEVEKAKKQTIGGRIKNAVEYLGAELTGFTESGEDYMVEWRDRGRTFRSRVDHNLRLLSAGICLDDREHEQSLASTVAVMRCYEGGHDYDD